MKTVTEGCNLVSYLFMHFLAPNFFKKRLYLVRFRLAHCLVSDWKKIIIYHHFFSMAYRKLSNYLNSIHTQAQLKKEPY